jgi:hypothetical protein
LDQGHPSFLSQAEAMFNEEHSRDEGGLLPPTVLGEKSEPVSVLLEVPASECSPEEHIKGIESVWASFKGFVDNQVLPLFSKGKPVTEAHYDTARQDMTLLEGHLRALKKGKSE